MPIQTLLISMHFASTRGSHTLLMGRHWKVIAVTVIADYVDMKSPTAQSMRLKFLPGKMHYVGPGKMLSLIALIG